jgi:FAD/FMN-containing dehydrogenase
MPNLPDINKQTLAGGLATGTHGTGKGVKALHGEVTAMRLVLPSGEVAECSRDARPELFHAARVGLGAFGVISEVTLQNRPLSRVKKSRHAGRYRADAARLAGLGRSGTAMPNSWFCRSPENQR